jgi:hypothetical protein
VHVRGIPVALGWGYPIVKLYLAEDPGTVILDAETPRVFVQGI